MEKNIWIHIISSPSKQALYINGIKELEDNFINAVEAFDILASAIENSPAKIRFTYYDACEEEDIDDDLFPERINLTFDMIDYE